MSCPSPQGSDLFPPHGYKELLDLAPRCPRLCPAALTCARLLVMLTGALKESSSGGTGASAADGEGVKTRRNEPF